MSGRRIESWISSSMAACSWIPQRLDTYGLPSWPQSARRSVSRPSCAPPATSITGVRAAGPSCAALSAPTISRASEFGRNRCRYSKLLGNDEGNAAAEIGFQNIHRRGVAAANADPVLEGRMPIQDVLNHELDPDVSEIGVGRRIERVVTQR